MRRTLDHTIDRASQTAPRNEIAPAADSKHVWLGVLLAALMAVLIWQLLTRSLAAYLALVSPETALALRSNEPTALVTLADGKLNAPPPESSEGDLSDERQRLLTDAERFQPSPDRLGGLAEIALKALGGKLPKDQKSASPVGLTAQDLAQIQAQAELALRNAPINARALRILGQLADASHQEERATKLMRAAANRSLSESFADFWMLQKSFEKKDYSSAVDYADVFLRKRPQLVDHVMPILARLAESEDPAAMGALQKVLATDPPWRSGFFSALLSRVKDARTPLNLLLSVRTSSTPPTTADLNGYLSFLIAHKIYELAYYTWLQFLSAEELGKVGLLTNGSFETTPSGLPFDWVISSGSGVTVDISPLPDRPDRRGLLLELGPGRVEFGGVSQVLFLSPGTYGLKGKIRGELKGRRGLQWRVLCLGTSAPLGESPMFVGAAPAWSDFTVGFSVPEKDCRAQQLRLDLAARSASEQLVSGSVWYDDLMVSRRLGEANQ